MSSEFSKYYYGSFSVENPVSKKIKIGEDFIFSTIDNLGFDDNLDRISDILNPLSGPFLIENVKNGDILEILIKEINFSRDIGISSSGILPEFLKPENQKPILGEQVFFWQINEPSCTPYIDEVIATKSIGVKKSIGCIRCADPKNLSSLDYDEAGGNIDYIGITEGTKIYIPVNFEKALLYVGDVHAAQSEGELGGSGVEISASLTLNINVAHRKLTNKIHLISENKITFFGFGDTLENAIKDANNQALNCSNDRSDERILSRLIIAQSVKINIVKLQQPAVVAIELSLDLFK